MTLPTAQNSEDDVELSQVNVRVPMISAKLRLREDRKRILHLCAIKLEMIKDSETNLRRATCINNTYSRLTEEVRREKRSRYQANLPKSDSSRARESSREVIPCCRLTIPNQPATCFNHCTGGERRVPPLRDDDQTQIEKPATVTPVGTKRRKSQVDSDLEILDQEINAIDASMPLIDPEITQGAEQLEKAVVSRKRTRMELHSDRFFALSQFYFPCGPRLPSSTFGSCSADDSTPGATDSVSAKRQRLLGPGMCFDTTALVDFDLGLDQHHHREFEVIMETLRLGSTVNSGGAIAAAATATTMPTSGAMTVPATDTCGQAAMLSEQCNGGGFHSLVVSSLET